MEALIWFIVAFLVGFCFIGILYWEEVQAYNEDELRRSKNQREQLCADIEHYLDSNRLDFDNWLKPIPRCVCGTKSCSGEKAKPTEKLADVRNRAFPVDKAEPVIPEPIYPTPPSWDSFVRDYPPPPPKK
jgi:hypothetical protein